MKQLPRLAAGIAGIAAVALLLGGTATAASALPADPNYDRVHADRDALTEEIFILGAAELSDHPGPVAGWGQKVGTGIKDHRDWPVPMPASAPITSEDGSSRWRLVLAAERDGTSRELWGYVAEADIATAQPAGTYEAAVRAQDAIDFPQPPEAPSPESTTSATEEASNNPNPPATPDDMEAATPGNETGGDAGAGNDVGLMLGLGGVIVAAGGAYLYWQRKKKGVSVDGKAEEVANQEAK